MKNIIYTPGIISITGLLIILQFVALPALIPVKYETVIKHTLLSEDHNNPFSGYQLIDQTIKKKKVIHIDLTGNSNEDDKKICFIQSEARRLKYTNDIMGIIEIHISDEINYGRFVELVNIMLKDEHKRYGLWKNNFYIFGEDPPVNLPADTTDSIKPLYL